MERYVIHVTKLCNMKCRYCYEQDKTSTYSWKEIESLCFNIINSNVNGKPYSVEFLGGEPMLEFDYITRAVKLFKDNDREHAISFIITTNGTIVNDKLFKFLKDNPDVIFAISMDGTEYANKERLLKNDTGNSYNIVCYNIKMLFINDIPTEQLGVHMVTHPLNAMMIYDSIKDIYDMGIRNISVGTIENSYIVAENYRENFLSEMNRVSHSIVSGEFQDLYIDILHSFNIDKPRNRVYIRDKNGKMIGESYGEMTNDITKTDTYDSVNVTSPMADFIFNLRKDACLNYRKIKENHDNNGNYLTE